MNKVNINKASFDELQKIIHIGPKRAEEIINIRADLTIFPFKFKDIHEVSKISHLGKKRMADIIKQDIIEF